MPRLEGGEGFRHSEAFLRQHVGSSSRRTVRCPAARSEGWCCHWLREVRRHHERGEVICAAVSNIFAEDAWTATEYRLRIKLGDAGSEVSGHVEHLPALSSSLHGCLSRVMSHESLRVPTSPYESFCEAPRWARRFWLPLRNGCRSTAQAPRSSRMQTPNCTAFPGALDGGNQKGVYRV